MPTTAVRGAANWEDSFAIGPTRLHVRRSGNVIVWRLTGCPGLASKAQVAELVAVFWQRVRRCRGTLEQAWDYLIPRAPNMGGPLAGGVGWNGPVNGVLYVDRHQ